MFLDGLKNLFCYGNVTCIKELGLDFEEGYWWLSSSKSIGIRVTYLAPSGMEKMYKGYILDAPRNGEKIYRLHTWCPANWRKSIRFTYLMPYEIEKNITCYILEPFCNAEKVFWRYTPRFRQSIFGLSWNSYFDTDIDFEIWFLNMNIYIVNTYSYPDMKSFGVLGTREWIKSIESWHRYDICTEFCYMHGWFLILNVVMIWKLAPCVWK